MIKTNFSGNILLTENGQEDNFYPFSATHCLWEIRTGALRHFEKIEAFFAKKTLHFSGRKKHVDSFNARFGKQNSAIEPTGLLVLDASVVPNDKFFNAVEKKLVESSIFKFRNKIVAIYINPESFNINLEYWNTDYYGILSETKFPGFRTVDLADIDKLEYQWDTLDLNGDEIDNDSQFFGLHFGKFYQPQFHNVNVLDAGNIILGQNARIAPSVVLDASKGKIIIGNNVTIMPQATVVGPCYIGDNTVIKIGAKIYPGCTFGEWCKIGGELENTIVHAYSNKQHEGFLGHSYIGEWVNFGADTNNSDLKNTYSSITMNLPTKQVDTGRIFLGLMCGDHTKTGINSMFTTGTVAGVCGILVKEWFLPNYIKSFSWGGKHNSPIYKFEKAVETAHIVMKRRNRDLLDEEIILLEDEYKQVISE